MKAYPTIPRWNKGVLGEKVVAFDKLDGSNVRAEWSKKRGWYKFGSRTQLLDATHPHLGSAIELFQKKYGEALPEVFRDHYPYSHSVVVFVEFVGPNSFAGFHVETDPKDVVLFDVSPHKRGLLSPREFLKAFGHLHVPKVVYEGNFNASLVERIQQDETLTEGVVCKADNWMVKIKTFRWLKKLKQTRGERAWQEEGGDLDAPRRGETDITEASGASSPGSIPGDET